MVTEIPVLTRARAAMRSAVVWDNHGCMPLRTDTAFLPQLERYRRSGVSVVSINIGFGESSWQEHLLVLSAIRRWVGQRPDEYRLIATVDDVLASKKDGKLGVVFDIEGMRPVQDDLSLVQTFYELGVRWMLIAYNRNNKAGGGCLDKNGTLTALGRTIIDEMERVGMVLCLSHSSACTAAEAIEYSSNPPILSHSNPAGDTPHARNVSDTIIRACAARGGVIGLSGIDAFLGASGNVGERLLRQLRYVIDLVGTEHVGLGLDYVFDTRELEESVRANPSLYPSGLSSGLAMVSPEEVGAIAEGLAHDNLNEKQIGAILGGNWLRIAREVWR